MMLKVLVYIKLVLGEGLPLAIVYVLKEDPALNSGLRAWIPDP